MAMKRIRPWLLCIPAIAGCGAESGDDDRLVRFPDDFLWGTASAAYQAEGTDDPNLGTVPSNWQQWEQLGQIADRQTNERGADFYNRYAADFDLAAGLGNRAYRLGVEWARIEPVRGQFNAAAIEHYREVLQAARDRGLEPIVTLYHWVVPTWVQSPVDDRDLLSLPPSPAVHNALEAPPYRYNLASEFAAAFIPFAQRMGEELGDLVDFWVVLNEPYTVLTQGYLTGDHPNGGTIDLIGLRNAALNYIIAHARGYDALKASDTQDADGDGQASFVGLTQVGSSAIPIDPQDPEDEAAAQRIDYLLNDWMMTAWTTGDLDVNADQDTVDEDGVLREGRYEELAGRLDYIGFNYYSPVRVSNCPGLRAIGMAQGPEAGELAGNIAALPQLAAEPGRPMSENGLEVYAPGLLDTLRIYNRYAGDGKNIYILENGHGDCNDDQRAKYIAEHIEQIGLGVAEGIPLAGYMLWSLTDNFEWSEGRHQCFGIYKVDYDTFERTETRTVPLYRAVIEKAGLDRALMDEYASGRYPTDCRSLVDSGERQACLDSIPPNPLAGLQQLIEGLCGD